MPFKPFRELMNKHFMSMVNRNAPLFEVELDKDAMWELYLDSFPNGTNEVFRVRREMDCSCCRHFIKTMGNVVAIENNKIVTLWDFDTGSPGKYQPVVDALAAFVRNHMITNIFLSPETSIGTKQNHQRTSEGEIITWDHFYLQIPKAYVCRGADIGTRKSTAKSKRDVFKRSLEELTLDAIDTILELIAQGSLYRGNEWKWALKEFRKQKKQYDRIPASQKDNWIWATVYDLNDTVARIRNTSMGTLLIDLSEGKDVNSAVTAYEKVVAPSNYKRPKAIFTKRMLEDAQKTVAELGYMESLGRRFATLDDITINNILFSNKDAAARMSGVDNPFAAMAKTVPMNPKQFSRVEEVSAEKFFRDILPTAQDLEVFLENRHAANMVSLIAPVNPNAKSMFKWENAFSWAYTGNVTDSSIRENVKNAGGKVDGVLRFSIQWNDGAEYDVNDVDAHCEEPSGRHIYYAQSVSPLTRGNLDVDITVPSRNKAAVENITWPLLSAMEEGTYTFYVRCFAYRGGHSGFRAEIEFNGQIYSFDYNQSLRQGQQVAVADVTLRNGVFAIKEHLKSNVSSREIWGVSTNQFVPVTVAMYSPNYWDEQAGNGNRHYFFMLKNCVNPERPNGFYNEFIKQELLQHKRVFEALGSQMAVQDVDDQLSGIGFADTKRNDIVVKVKGATERVVKVKF